MPNHFQNMGLPVSDAKSFEAFMDFAAHAGTARETAAGYYIHWTPGEGVEAWVQASLERKLCGCSPHFAGAGRVRARIEKLIPSESSALDGSAQGWLLLGNEPVSPFFVDLPAFALDAAAWQLAGALPDVTPAEPPRDVTLQIAAFPRLAQCFADRQALHASGTMFAELAVAAFMPKGLFPLDDAKTDGSKSEVIFCGTIKRHELKTNPLTRMPFHHFVVESLGGTYDVPCSPEALQGHPASATILAGAFYLGARLMP